MIKHLKRLLFAGLGVVISTSILPGSTFAQDEWFWAMRFVDWVLVPWTDQKREDSLIKTIRTAINRVLWILATVALCLCLYAGFLMLTSGWDSKKYSEWFTILKNAAIWLAIIWTSRLIVSLIFWLINGSIKPNIDWWQTTNQ